MRKLNSQHRKGKSNKLAAAVAHEHFGRMRVVAQETEDSANQRAGQKKRLESIVCIGHDRNDDKTHERLTRRQTVQAI